MYWWSNSGLQGLRGRGHALFRRGSLLNPPLFVGFPGFVSKLWPAHDEHGVYRGFYEWDGPDRAEAYARALWRVLVLVSARDSIHYRVLPGPRRDEIIDQPRILGGDGGPRRRRMVATIGRCVTIRPDVLVMGAGPARLATALCAYDHGATVRIVERRPAAFRPSRARVLHARTLGVLRPAGVVAALLDRADIAPRALLRLGTRMVPVTLAGFDRRDTQFAHMTLIRQMEVENVLAGALGDRGVAIERGTELVGMRDVGPVDG